MAAVDYWLLLFLILPLQNSGAQKNGHLLVDNQENMDLELPQLLNNKSFLGASQNAIQQTHPRYKCYSCEPPCKDPTKHAHMCQNAIQCWKSRTRNAFGEEMVSRGCATLPEELLLICNQNTMNNLTNPRKRHAVMHKNVTCCSGDYCNDGEFAELPPIADGETGLSADNSMKLGFIFLGPLLVFILILIALAVVIFVTILCVRRYRRKRLVLSRTNQDPKQEENMLT